MAWVWFVLFAIILADGIRNSLNTKKIIRTYGSMVDSLIAIAVNEKTSAEKVAVEYLHNLDISLADKDYDSVMTEMCKQYGLVFHKSNDDLLDDNIREQLAQKIADDFKMSKYQIQKHKKKERN